ncbi:hypothetical protein tb265_19750 [Gemmatimonadetes bacterium T265]|nr:hypothetical protein tb265_19750 [Gemmatimonadetes bacterium T265]
MAAAATLTLGLGLLTGCGRDPTQPARPGASTPSASDWLAANVVPLATVDPTADLGDLAPLGTMVGDAHLVAFGEATHGTREFFKLKHRALEYLVRQKGFTAFAIEASLPEANAVDLYVRTGQGDPAVLLSNLYFWTWNTQEVLDLIRWMRTYNAGVSPDRQVRFFGFDMQFPGAAIDSAAAFVHRVDPARAAAVDSAYACLAPYRNHGPQPGPASYAQAAQTAPAVRLACAASVAGAHAQLAGAQAAYTGATSAAECQQHRRRGQIQRSRSGHITRWARHLRRAGVGRADQPCGGAARGSSPRGW